MYNLYNIFDGIDIKFLMLRNLFVMIILPSLLWTEWQHSLSFRVAVEKFDVLSFRDKAALISKDQVTFKRFTAMKNKNQLAKPKWQKVNLTALLVTKHMSQDKRVATGCRKSD